MLAGLPREVVGEAAGVPIDAVGHAVEAADWPALRFAFVRVGAVSAQLAAALEIKPVDTVAVSRIVEGGN